MVAHGPGKGGALKRGRKKCAEEAMEGAWRDDAMQHFHVELPAYAAKHTMPGHMADTCIHYQAVRFFVWKSEYRIYPLINQVNILSYLPSYVL